MLRFPSLVLPLEAICLVNYVHSEEASKVYTIATSKTQLQSNSISSVNIQNIKFAPNFNI